MPRLRGAALALIVALVVPATAGAEAPLPVAKPDPIALPHVPGVVLVGFTPGATADQKASARARVGASARPISPLATDAERWDLPHGLTTERAIATLAGLRILRYAEPDWIVTASDTSNDPSFLDGSLWGMYGAGTTPANQYGSNAAAAWARGYTGSPDVYVGIIDTGVQYAHPDLAANFWTNPAEAAGTAGADDDGNGKIDDLHGWDFVRNDNTVFDADEHYHGTHVAGTIGGVGGNGAGVVGVNWRVKMISGKFLGPGGSGSTDAAAAAVDYMTQLKIQKGINLVATSNSWGGGGFSQTLLDAINRGGDQGILFIAAAGNGYSDNDAVVNYPSNLQCTTRKDTGQPRGWDCVVAVAAIDNTGAKAGFSNWGLTTVDLGAPGVATYSTYPPSTYGTLSGTSMATPHVSGAAAFCKSVYPSITPAGIRAALLNSVAPTASLTGKTVTGGRLDVNALIDACLPPSGPPTGSVTNVTVGSVTTSSMALTWTSDATGQAWFDIAQAPSSSGVCGTFVTVATAGATSRSATLGGLSPSSAYCVRIRASNSFGGGASTDWSTPTTGVTAAPPSPYVCSATTFAWVDPTGGTNMNMSDDSTYALTLPFSYLFYGTSYTGVMVSSNGFLRPGGTSGSYYSNVPMPNTAEPNGIAAVAWDDWNPTSGGSVSYRIVGSAPSRRFVVTWLDVPEYGYAGNGVTFQAILEEGSDVVRYQYLDMVTGYTSFDYGATATSGFESQTGEFATQLSYNTRSLFDGTATRCSRVVGVAPVIDTASLPDGTTGTPYSVSLAASGGVGPYSWTLTSGILPGGLSLTSGGTIAGTPTTAETATFTVKAVGTDGGTSSRTLTISVATPVAVTTASLPAGTAGSGYSSTLAASGGTTPYAWSVAGGALPTSLALSSGGVISGTPSVAGSYSFTVRATDGVGRVATSGLSILVYDALAIGTTSLPGGETGAAYSTTLAASGAVGPYAWSLASGALPGGLLLSSDGVISGAPTGSGTSSFSVRVSAANGASATRALSISVVAPLAVSTASLASGTGGAAYAASLGASGGSGSYTWSATGLPAGLAVSGGTISGTPTASGTYTVGLTVTDGGGRTATRSLSLALAFGKRSPAGGTKFANTVRSVTLAWSAHAGVTSYQWCATKTSKCTNWTAANSNTSATLTVAPGETWTWQVQALVNGTWTNANGNTSWKFSVNR